MNCNLVLTFHLGFDSIHREWTSVTLGWDFRTVNEQATVDQRFGWCTGKIGKGTHGWCK